MSSEEVEVEDVVEAPEPVIAPAVPADTVVVTWLHESVKFAKVGEPVELGRQAAWAYFRQNWCTKPPGVKPSRDESPKPKELPGTSEKPKR